MLANIRCLVKLREGSRVAVRLRGHDDPSSYELYQKYNGRQAVVLGQKKTYVQVLDWDGRLPGLYLDPNRLQVRFADESVQVISTEALELLDTPEAVASKEEGALVEWTMLPIVYPGDLIQVSREATPTQVPEYAFPCSEGLLIGTEPGSESANLIRVDGVYLDETGYYTHWRDTNNTLHWAHVNDVMVATPGPVHLVYTGRWEELRFKDFQEKLSFWSNPGFSEPVSPPEQAGIDSLLRLTLATARREDTTRELLEQYLALLESDEADFVDIQPVLEIPGWVQLFGPGTSIYKPGARYSCNAYKLHAWVDPGVAQGMRNEILYALQNLIACLPK